MIAAVLAPDNPPTIEHHSRKFSRVTATQPSSAAIGRSTGVFAYPGHPSGQSEPGERVWIGDLRRGAGSRLDWRGDFALAEACGEDELLLAKGRFGGRPLFYATDPATNSVVACSRIGPLVAALGDSSLDLGALGAYLMWATPHDIEQTIYRRIRRVLGASAVRLGVEGIRERWSLQGAVQKRAGNESIDDLGRELRDRIDGAIERAVGTANDVALALSGGVDSSSLLALTLQLAQRRGFPRIHSINLHYAAPGDDRPHLREVCKALKIDAIRVRPRDCASLLSASLVVDGAPFPWPGAAFEIRYGQLSRERDASVLLSGVGGDDVFNGDLTLFAARARRGHILSAFRGAATLEGLGVASRYLRVRKLLLYPSIRQIIGPRLTERIRSRRRQPIQWAGPRLRQLNVIRNGLLDGALDRERYPDRSIHGHMILARYYVWAKETMAQLEIAGGMTRKAPYMDDDVVEFLDSIPPERLLHGGWVRGLFRHAMRGLIPESVRTRPDKARFEPALAELIGAAGGFQVLEPLISMSALGDLGLVEPRIFRRRFEELARSPLNGRLWMELWPALTAEAFVRGLYQTS